MNIRIDGICYYVVNTIDYEDNTLPYHPVTFSYNEGDEVCEQCNDNSFTTPCPTYTPTQTPQVTQTNTPTKSSTPVITPTYTETPTNTPVSTLTPTNTVTSTVTQTLTRTPGFDNSIDARNARAAGNPPPSTLYTATLVSCCDDGSPEYTISNTVLRLMNSFKMNQFQRNKCKRYNWYIDI